MQLRIKYFFLLVLPVFPLLLFAQVGDTGRVQHFMAVVNKTKLFISDSLHLQTGKGFFDAVRDSNGVLQLPQFMYHYVYVSYPGEIKSATGRAFRWFGSNDTAAGRYADSCRNMGLDVLVYKTAGTSAAKLNGRMFGYSDLSAAFIVLHEAVHRHKQNVKSKLPYVFEEALCDFMANEFLYPAIGEPILRDSMFLHRLRNERIYDCINRTLQNEMQPQLCEKEIKQLAACSDSFFCDRYIYPVNNAYLLRFRDYTKYYFELKKLYACCQNRDEFVKKVFALRLPERKAVARMRKWTCCKD